MRVLKSIYNFLCGDPFILATTLVSFVVSGLLVSVVRAPNLLVVIVFVGLIVAGLVLALARERHAGKR